MKEFYTVFLLWLLEDVWGVHGMESVIGIIMPGLFAAKTVNPAMQTDTGFSLRFNFHTAYLKPHFPVLILLTFCHM